MRTRMSMRGTEADDIDVSTIAVTRGRAGAARTRRGIRLNERPVWLDLPVRQPLLRRKHLEILTTTALIDAISTKG